MKKKLFILSFLLLSFFSLSSFGGDVENVVELPPMPCDSAATISVVSHPVTDELVFTVLSSVLDDSYSYNWEITRQNGTKVYGTGRFLYLAPNCAYGERIVRWKVTVSKGCQTKLEGGSSGGIC